MNLREHFENNQIEASGVELDQTEEQELISVLRDLIDLQQKSAEEEDPGKQFFPYTAEMALELAGLAFIAGMSYQLSEHPDSSVAVDAANEDDGKITLRVSPDTASRLIEFLLGEG